MYTGKRIEFPTYTGIRCLMMPYIQGEPASVPEQYAPYHGILEQIFFERGQIGFLTIDESPATAGIPHRGQRAKFGRAIHTEVGIDPDGTYGWGWGSKPYSVTLARDVQILIANNLDGTCAVWDVEHPNTSEDGDIGYAADQYPYADATFMKAGEVHQIGILTPHESVAPKADCNRQFLRILSSGVRGREEYFTRNPLVDFG